MVRSRSAIAVSLAKAASQTDRSSAEGAASIRAGSWVTIPVEAVDGRSSLRTSVTSRQTERRWLACA
jgi:hypothetical protein